MATDESRGSPRLVPLPRSAVPLPVQLRCPLRPLLPEREHQAPSAPCRPAQACACGQSVQSHCVIRMRGSVEPEFRKVKSKSLRVVIYEGNSVPAERDKYNTDRGTKSSGLIVSLKNAVLLWQHEGVGMLSCLTSSVAS